MGGVSVSGMVRYRLFQKCNDTNFVFIVIIINIIILINTLIRSELDWNDDISCFRSCLWSLYEHIL